MKRICHFMNIQAFLLIALSLGVSQCAKDSGKEGKDLEAGFVNPPDSARPRVWWHWMNGNITKQGIRADLEWMHRVGIAGFQNFDASLETPQIVEKRLVYMTPEWKDAFQFTARLADSLGLEMAIAGSPGWSESGGPWVKPGQAMKKFVWTETTVEGGKPFNGMLPAPDSVPGPFRDMFSHAYGGGLIEQGPRYYADAAVIAYRIPDQDIELAAMQPVVTSSGGKFTLAQLTDGNLSTASLLPAAKPGQVSWIQFDYGKPVSVAALTIVGGGYVGMWGRNADHAPRALESSDDGKTFSKVTDIPISGTEEKTLSFEPVRARYFRFTWLSPVAEAADRGTNVAELVLYPVARVREFEQKAGFSVAYDLYKNPTPSVNQGQSIPKSDVIDITSNMKPDGMLTWDPPAGKWKVIRLGYSLTGHQNSPASPEATGLEVDKLNAAHVKAYFNNYLDQYKDATGGLMGKKGLQYMITDSWEAGTQNWTDNMPAEFERLRGYSMMPWIPVLTGHIVESAEASDRFLWDFRKTIGDLTTVNHYDQLTSILKERGMGRYTESHEGGRAFIGDGMEVKRHAAIPMSATWTPGLPEEDHEVSPGYQADVRESASVAHIFGQNLVAAESMTAIGSAWAWSPETLKPTADMEMANGLNRFVIHTSVHQPVNDKIPGLGLGPFGQWFTRHETWAEEAGPWITYLSRSCYMLQQGKFVADIAWYYGEDKNITALFGDKKPGIPTGYNYDFVNADALLNNLSVENGKIVTATGMRYRVLALDSNSRWMTLPVLRKIYDLVGEGAVVAGPKPVGTPSLSDNLQEWNKLAAQLWQEGKNLVVVGKGKVFAGTGLEEVMRTISVQPDFSYAGEANLLYVHRAMKNTDIYWINNCNNKPADIEASFRISGKEPEIWHAETGAIEKVSWTAAEKLTKVPLHLQAHDAIFIVFRNTTNEKSGIIPAKKESQLAVIDGPWNISFQEKRGAPAQAVFNALSPWNENADKGIRYFSGTAVYSRSFEAPAEWLKEGKQIWIDLGDVKNIAEVKVNGQSLGIAWKYPFRIDITSALKQGKNVLDIKVTNLWVNRLIGDQQPGVKDKITYTTMPFYQANSPLKPSGLIGPVNIISIE
jgi:hypothetical protein